jgi:hypothetical protein
MEHPYHRHPEHKQKVNGNQRRTVDEASFFDTT